MSSQISQQVKRKGVKTAWSILSFRDIKSCWKIILLSHLFVCKTRELLALMGNFHVHFNLRSNFPIHIHIHFNHHQQRAQTRIKALMTRTRVESGIFFLAADGRKSSGWASAFCSLQGKARKLFIWLNHVERERDEDEKSFSFDHMCVLVESLQQIDWLQIYLLSYSKGILDRDTTLQDHRGPYCGTNWHATATAEHSLWRCADTHRWRSTCAALYRTDRKHLSRVDRKRAWHSTERSNSSERWAQQSADSWLWQAF